MKLIGLLVLCALPALPQAAAQANAGYRTEEQRANIAKTLAAPDRDHRQKPKELVESLKLKPGLTVADIGTGVGYLLPHLSAAVGANGRVIAEDIFPDFLNQAKTTGKDLKNVTYVLGTDSDPKLPAGAVDLILVLDAYHHFDYPEKMLAGFHRALKPNGRLVIVDFYKREGAMGEANSRRALEHIRIDEPDVVKEIEANGFRLLTRREHIPKSQYVAEFGRR